MGALLGLVLGCGLLLIWRSGSRAPAARLRLVARWSTRQGALLRQAGVDGIAPAQLLAADAMSGALAALIVSATTRTLAVAVCFGAFGALIPEALVRRRRGQRQIALRELWPDAIDNLASAVRAGMSLPEGMGALATRGPVQLRAPFARFSAAYRASGRFGECLDALKYDLCDPVADRICETVRIAREVGGTDLGAVLRTLSELMRADARTRAELETRQGWIVNAARLAVAAPWVVLLLLGTRSTATQAFDSPAGTFLLAIGAGVCALAYQIMLRIGRLRAEQRVLQ